MKIKPLLSIVIFVGILAFACHQSDDYIIPKPKGYFRIEFKEKEYHLYDSLFPFTFEKPVYSKIEIDSSHEKSEIRWFNISFPQYMGKLHCSFATLNNNLQKYTEDTYEFVYKHVPKADNIEVQQINNPEKKVYAMMYYIRGTEAASPLQFYITDSTTSFLRAALYFNHEPNNDSISPIIDYITDDVQKMISTFQWKSLGHSNQ